MKMKPQKKRLLERRLKESEEKKRQRRIKKDIQMKHLKRRQQERKLKRERKKRRRIERLKRNYKSNLQKLMRMQGVGEKKRMMAQKRQVVMLNYNWNNWRAKIEWILISRKRLRMEIGQVEIRRRMLGINQITDMTRIGKIEIL